VGGERRGRALEGVRRGPDKGRVAAVDGRFDGGHPDRTVVQKQPHDFQEQLLVASEPPHQSLEIDGAAGCRGR